ncbi:hypothetical protein L0156_12030 [bacterium]|nr:hypothetical protein [bacterium]
MEQSALRDNCWAGKGQETFKIQNAFRLLFERAEQIRKPRSIAELQLTREDVIWIKNWFSQLPNYPEHWQGDKSPIIHENRSVSVKEMFGALLIVLSAEICREDSIEDSVWSVVRLCIPEEQNLRKRFFPGGQPSFELKNAIASGAKALSLRHVIDWEGTQEYFITTKLQFGFTRRGASNHLAEWLVGLGVPFAVQLLSGESTRPELASETFKNLWSNLRDYRKGHLDEHKMRAILARSPWVKEHWIDFILSEARSRIERLGTGEERTPHVESKIGGESLQAVSLSWPTGEKPRIQLYIEREQVIARAAEFNSKQIIFSVDDKPVERWILQPDGGWLGSDKISCEPPSLRDRPNLQPTMLTISTKDGDLLEEVDLTLKGLQDDVVVFDLGRSEMLIADEDFLDPHREYGLLCHCDLEIAGMGGAFEWQNIGSKKVFRLSPPWSDNVRLVLGDLVFWEPCIRKKLPPERIKIILRTPQNNVIPVGSKSILIVEGLPPDTVKAMLLLGNKKIQIVKHMEEWQTASPVDLSVHLALGLTRTRVEVQRYHSLRCYQPKLALQLTGMAVMQIGQDGERAKWNVQDPTQPINVGGRTTGRLFNASGRRDFLVYEGPRLAARLRSQIFRFSDLQGWGQAVTLDVPQNCLARSTEDRGCVLYYSDVLLGKRIELLRFRQPLDPGPDHNLLVLNRNCQLERPLQVIPLTGIHVENEGLVWRVNGLQNVVALGLSFQGARLGSYWSVDEIVKLLQGEISPTIHAVLRWLKIPVLSEPIRAAMQRVVYRSPFAFVQAWWQSECLQHGLKHIASDDGIESVVRTFLWNWRGSRKEIMEKLLVAFGATQLNKYDERINALITAGKLCPQLIWRFRSYLRPHWIVEQAFRRILDVPDDFPKEKFESVLKEFEYECSRRVVLQAKELRFLADEMLQALEEEQLDRCSRDEELRRISETIIGRAYLVASILYKLYTREVR